MQCLDDSLNVRNLLLCPVITEDDLGLTLEKGQDSYEYEPYTPNALKYKYVDSSSETCSSYCSNYEVMVDGKIEQYVFYYNVKEGYEYAGIYRKVTNDGYTVMCNANNKISFVKK